MKAQVIEMPVEVPEMTPPKFDEDFVKMSAFAAEIESAIRRAESASSATLDDNRFFISTGKYKWAIYIRRINDFSSEVVSEIIE